MFCQHDYCYSFTGDGWSKDYFLQYDHGLGAGAQFTDDTYMITGGFLNGINIMKRK